MAARCLMAWIGAILLCLGNGAVAASSPLPDLSEYDVYYGDMDSEEHGPDGYADILLRGRPGYTLISGNASFPVSVPSGLPDLLYCGSASGEFGACTLKDGADVPGQPTDEFNALLQDWDGDGIPDLLLQARDPNTRSLVLKMKSNGQLSLAGQFTAIGGDRISGLPTLTAEEQSAIESAVSNSTDEEVLATAEASPQALTANLVGATPGSLDVVQGQLKYSIPINLPEGPAGINPSFSINYSSDAGYGHVGMGFHVGGLSYIERCPMTKTLLRDGYSLGVSGTTDDRLCLDGERLVRVAGSAWANGTVYRTERMSGSKIVYSRTAGADYDQGTFIVYQKNGDVYYYGETAGTRIRGGRHVNDSVSRWALQKVQDRLGYGYEISYVSGSGAKFPYRIRYTMGLGNPIHDVHFSYIADSYDTSWYLFGKKYSSSRVLSKITVKTHAATVRSWNFSYQLNTDTRRRLLTEFQECGVANECLMATTLTWNHGRLSPLSTTVKKTFDAGYWETPWRWWVDVNNDGLTDFCDVDMERVDEPFEEDEYGFEHTVYCYVSNGSGGFGSPVRVTQEDELYTRSISPMNMDPDPFQPAWNLDADWLNYRNWGYQSMCFTVPGDGVDQIVCYHPQISANGAVTFNKSLGQELTLPTVNVRGIKRRDWIDVNGDGYYDYCYRMHISSADRIVCAEGAEPDGAGPRFTGEWVAPTVVVGSLAGIWIDMNADGLPDYCWFTGGSSSSAKCYANKNGALDVTETPWNIGAAHLIKEENAQFWHSGWNDFESTFVDYDGNGYPDYCRIYVDRSVSADAYRASCLRNDGKGWLQDHKSPILNVNPTQVKGLSFSDVNLDSNVDWCLQIGSELKCQLGRFGNFTSATEAYSMPQAPTTLYDHNWSDITGDGVPRLCAAGKNLLQCWNDNNPEVPDYLSSIENGFGLNYRVLYADTTDKHLFGHTEAGESTQLQASMASPYDIGRKLKVKSAIRVVSHLFTSNGIGGETEQAYKYGDYWYYPNEVGGIGFDYIATESEGGKKIKEVWYSMDALQGIAGMPRSETIKYQSNGGYVDVQRKYYTWQPYIYFGNGFVYDNNGQSVTFSSIFDRSTRELRYDVRLVRTNEYNYDLNGSRIRSETNNREYNRYGDLVLDEQFVRGAVGSPGLVRTAESAFSNNEGEWILGRLLQTTTSYVDQIGGSNVVRASEWEYYSSGPFLGMLKSEIIEPGSENEVRTEYTYNAFGLKASQVVTPRGKTPRTSQFGYDPSGRFLTSVTNDIGQTTSFGYDPTTGRKTSQTGPDGVTVSWDYDAVGRQVAEWLPAGQSKRKEMALCLASCPQLATYFVKSWTADINGNRISPLEYQYIDVLGRSIETRIDGFSGEQIIQRTEYDAFGEILSKSEPYIPGSTIYLSRVQSRDLLGRPTKESLPSWLVVDTTYNGLTTTKTIRGSRVTSQVKTITKDAYGRTQKVVDTDGRAIEYRYDATGNIVEVKLPNQTSITKQYDRMGRVIVNHDPNLGQWRYAYDADGLLVLQEDGNGKRACFSYDSLLRKTKRVDDYKPSAGWESAVVSAKASCQGQVPTTTWAYDQGDSGIGKLTSVLHENGYAEEYSYDVYGRQYERSVDVEGMSVVETKLFDDVTGQLREKTPLHRTNGPSVTLAYHYSTNGYLESIRDAEDAEYYYWKIKNQDARGNVTERDIAGGMLSEVLAYQPHDGKRQAQGVKAVYGDRYLFYGSYAYDAKGRMYAHVLANNIPISGPSDPSDGDLEYMRSDFTYDVHDRLVTEKVYDLKVGVEVPLIENHIQYDSSGNVVDRSDVGLYTYGEQCSVGGVTYTPGPNAVTSVAGARESEYCYDAAGNMLEGNGRQVQYSSFNMPVAIQGAGGASASFTYGPDRELIRTVRSSQAKQIDQIQIGEYEYLKVTEAGSESVKERIRLPGGVVLEFEDGQSQQEHYLVSDALGSVVMVADKLGQVVSRYRYDPWGRPRTTDGVGTISDQQWRAFQRLEDASASGFTGHDMLDEIGLVHMGGRVYEPTLGRFLSPDPIVKGLDNVESYNRYSYALNSPLNYTDPTGYSWFGDLWDRFTNSISKRLGSVMALLINPQLSLPVITYRDGGRELARFAGRNKYAGEILSVVGAAGCTFTSIGAPACMSAYQAWTSSSMTYGGGGSTADALFAGTYSGALAYTNATVAHHIRLQPWGRLGKGMAHGARGAYFASFGGGGNRAAWSGFAGGFAEGALGGRIRGALEKQGLDATTSGVLTSALIGGTASEISGGKFAVGAATAAMGYLANEMSEGGDGEDGASTVDYLMRGLQVIGGGGQALLGGGMCYYSVGIACAGGALILTKGIDNMQAGIRGTSSFSEQALIAATGSESAGIMINAGLDIGTSTVGLIRSVPKVNAFGNQVWKGFRHNPSMFEPAYRQMTGYGLGSEFINSSGTLYQTYDGLKE